MNREIVSLEEQIQGRAQMRILREFATNSAIFPFFDAIRAIVVQGLPAYLAEAPHYLMFAAAGFQAWFLGVRRERPAWQFAFGNLIAPTLYTLLDLVLEGPQKFIGEPSHWLFWIYSLGMALLYFLNRALPNAPEGIAVLTSLARVGLFPVTYALSEFQGELSSLSFDSIGRYVASNAGHLFIVMASLLFGLLLGLSEAQNLRYLGVLRDLAGRLKIFSEWSLDTDLIARSVGDPSALSHHRVERAVLFMDIRNFTRWSETRDPETVVGMLNKFYAIAEQVIQQGRGQKPHFIADEVMTWFADPSDAVKASRTLRDEICRTLGGYDLAPGIGVHLGDVVEGLMGSSRTRSYNIIGDTVNTAARLCAAARPGEVLVSKRLAQRLMIDDDGTGSRAIQAKGKDQPIIAYPL